jgi:hypothetical protein
MRGVLTTLYVLSAIALLFIPALQVRLHWKLARPDNADLSRLGIQNHILVLLAGASAAGLYYCVNPETNIRVDLLLAIPLSILIVLLWGMFSLRLSHLKK